MNPGSSRGVEHFLLGFRDPDLHTPASPQRSTQSPLKTDNTGALTVRIRLDGMLYSKLFRQPYGTAKL